MHCEKCGTKRNPDSAFCHACGAPRQTAPNANPARTQSDIPSPDAQATPPDMQSGYSPYTATVGSPLKPPVQNRSVAAILLCAAAILINVYAVVGTFALMADIGSLSKDQLLPIIRALLFFALWGIPLFLVMVQTDKKPVLNYITAGGLGAALAYTLYNNVNYAIYLFADGLEFLSYPELLRGLQAAVIVLNVLWYGLMILLMIQDIHKPNKIKKLAMLLLVVMALLVVWDILYNFALSSESVSVIAYGMISVVTNPRLYATLAVYFYAGFQAKKTEDGWLDTSVK